MEDTQENEKKGIATSVNEALKSVENEVPLEMIAADIKEAFDTLGEIIGKSYNEELLDELFSNFCLGK